MWTDNEYPRDRGGRSRYESRKSEPPPDFHFIQSVDKSPEVKKEGELDRKYGSPAEKLRSRSIRGCIFDCLDEIWRGWGLSLGDSLGLVRGFDVREEKPSSGDERQHCNEEEVVVHVDPLEILDPYEGSCGSGNNSDA